MTRVFYFTSEYFPCIASFSELMNHDSIEIQAAEHYQKNSLRNRCYLTGSQGKYLLSVPLVKGKNQQQKIKDVRISYDFDWTTLHLKTISNNYIKSPFFNHYYPAIVQILMKKELMFSQR